MPDEEWLSPVLEDHVLALGDIVQVHLDLGHGQDVGGGGHGSDQILDNGSGHVGGADTGNTTKDIGEGPPDFLGVCLLYTSPSPRD